MGQLVGMDVETLRAHLATIVSPEFTEISRESGPMGNDGRVVVFPGTEQEIINIMKFAHTQRLTINPVGGGTKVGLGGTQKQADILMSLKRLRGILEYSAADLTLTALPGTPVSEIEELLEKHGQRFPLDVPHPEEATLGGVIAANSSGWKRIRSGAARDAVIALRVVYPDGTLIRTGAKVVKNVAGYDMNKLFVGSMGTLAVITEVTVKLRPRPAYERVFLIRGEYEVDRIARLSSEILNSHMEPVALEILNPSLYQQISGNWGYGLVVSFEDVETSVCYQTDWFSNLVSEFGLTKDKTLQGPETAPFWKMVRQLPPTHETGRIGFKAGTWLTDVGPFLEQATVAGKQFQLEIKAHGSAGTGISHLYINQVAPERFIDITQYLTEIRSFAEARDGYVIVEHAELAFRSIVNMWGKRDAQVMLSQQIKRKVDPARILSPSRFAGGM